MFASRLLSTISLTIESDLKFHLSNGKLNFKNIDFTNLPFFSVIRLSYKVNKINHYLSD